MNDKPISGIVKAETEMTTEEKTEYMHRINDTVNEAAAKSILDKSMEAYKWLLAQKP